MKAKVMNMKNKERGAVSLFIVIFTTLLVTVVTMSFIRIMLSDQRQATASDLSQSAYDSAQAGVEDAKRALLYYQSECAAGRCTDALSMMNSTACNGALVGVLGNVSGQEVQVQQSATDNALQQAYTCVKIALQTRDYIGTLNTDDSKLVPLVGVSSFDTVRLEWFSAKDLQGTSTAVNVPAFSPTGEPPLLNQTDWNSATTPNRPTLLRAQLMQFSASAGFELGDFDGGTNTVGTSNANTLFLYPTNIADSLKTFASNTRKVATKPTQVHCELGLGAGGYACTATVTLPKPINEGNRSAYLRLSALYKKTNYRVMLLNTGSVVQFDGVQPQIDSTGRANDLFRRVQSRVEVIDATFPYPDVAVDTTGNFCKDFLVTDDVTNYSSGCTP